MANNSDVFASLGKPVPFSEDVEGAPTPTPRVVAAPAPATPVVKPGVYDDTDGVYQYQLMDDGNIKILRSKHKSGAGTIVESNSVAHDAIMKNIMQGGAKPATVRGAAYDREHPTPKRAAKPKMPVADTTYEDELLAAPAGGPPASAVDAFMETLQTRSPTLRNVQRDTPMYEALYEIAKALVARPPAHQSREALSHVMEEYGPARSKQ